MIVERIGCCGFYLNDDIRRAGYRLRNVDVLKYFGTAIATTDNGFHRGCIISDARRRVAVGCVTDRQRQRANSTDQDQQESVDNLVSQFHYASLSLDRRP